MKKTIMLIALALSATALAGCGTNNDIISRLDNLEQRISSLEGNKLQTVQTNQSDKNSNSDTPQDNSDLNVLSFESVVFDKEYSESYVKNTYNITNNGSEPIEYISVDFAYYDANGNCLDTDGRFKDVVIEPGKFVSVDSYGGDESNKNNLSNSKVTSYYYYLVNPNANGNNKIEVNCETGKVKESFVER